MCMPTSKNILHIKIHIKRLTLPHIDMVKKKKAVNEEKLFQGFKESRFTCILTSETSQELYRLTFKADICMHNKSFLHSAASVYYDYLYWQSHKNINFTQRQSKKDLLVLPPEEISSI